MPPHQSTTPQSRYEDEANAVITTAQKLGNLSPSAWNGILMVFGLLVLGVVGYWHREDQRAMAELFATTIRQNTEALTRDAKAFEDVTRALERRMP